jgi:hypothetical protein
MLCSAGPNGMRSHKWQKKAEVTLFQISHTFSQDLDWFSLDNNDQVFSW